MLDVFTRTELEARWLQRVHAARRQYEIDLAQFNRILDNQKAGTAPTLSLSIHQARRRESASRCRYMRVLRTFTDLVVHHKVPEQDHTTTA
jgi:hypothetical protein